MGVKVIHVACSDIAGGASIAAYRLHSGLRRIGVQSSMLVRSKSSHDPDVQVVRRDGSYVGRLSRGWQCCGSARIFSAMRKVCHPRLSFSRMTGGGGDELTRSLPEGDVYNLHWVAGLLDYRRFFAELPGGTPLVWTLHDMNPFTGGCHYTLGCEKFKKGCGCCPQLGSVDASDLTFRVLGRKQASLEHLNPLTTRVVAPSRWMESEARTSALLGRFDVVGIPYGLDTDVFRPRDRRVAREVFGLPQNHRVVMFVAQSLHNHRKGYDLLVGALDGIAGDNDAPITLASVGEGGAEVNATTRSYPPRPDAIPASVVVCVFSRRRVRNPVAGRRAWSGCLEAMACGTPSWGSTSADSRQVRRAALGCWPLAKTWLHCAVPLRP